MDATNSLGGLFSFSCISWHSMYGKYLPYCKTWIYVHFSASFVKSLNLHQRDFLVIVTPQHLKRKKRWPMKDRPRSRRLDNYVERIIQVQELHWLLSWAMIHCLQPSLGIYAGKPFRSTVTNTGSSHTAVCDLVGSGQWLSWCSREY